jgi:hypothetical protein
VTEAPTEILQPADDELLVPYVVPMGAPRAIIVDLDGTVALKGDRGHFDWGLVGLDFPNWPVIEVVQAVIKQGYVPLFCSGRMMTEKCRQETMIWLYGHGLWGEQPEPKDHMEDGGVLFMRPDGDHRKDSVVKLEIFDREIRHKYAVLGVFDDRNQVVEMWRALGLTVFQVADGAF